MGATAPIRWGDLVYLAAELAAGVEPTRLLIVDFEGNAPVVAYRANGRAYEHVCEIEELVLRERGGRR